MFMFEEFQSVTGYSRVGEYSARNVKLFSVICIQRAFSDAPCSRYVYVTVDRTQRVSIIHLWTNLECYAVINRSVTIINFY